ncbi:MAG: caspase family protein [Deltaproteobacteria bacterium]
MIHLLLAAVATATTTTSSTAIRPAPAAPSVHRFGLVVGNNRPVPGSAYEPLRYADDDALRFAAFLERFGAHVELLVTADDDTMDRFGAAVRRAKPPRRDELERAIDRLIERLEETPAPREVYVYFSGHGSVDAASAYLHLLDGPFHRTDVYERILARIPRERMHVIIDSCHSYFLVNARGRVKAEPIAALDQHPDVGFVLSTSDRREVHEWSGYRAGVFSYQLLGALQGAADVDGDGRVSYAEMQAYVVAANLDVVNPRARIRPFVRRPTPNDHPLADLRELSPRERVVIPSSLGGRLRVYDGLGFPLLDANKPAGQTLTLMAPRGGLPTLEIEGARYAPALDEGRLAFTRATDGGAVLAARGTIDDDFRINLFRRPLTSEFVSGLEAARRIRFAPPPREGPRSWTQDPLTIGLGATGVAAVAVGGVFAGLFVDRRAVANRRPVTDQTEPARADAETFRTAMAVGLSVGGSLLVTAALNAWLGRTERAEDQTWTRD